MPSILDLPNELLNFVCGYLATPDVAALCLTCKYLHPWTSKALYTTIKINTISRSHLKDRKFQEDNERLCSLIRTLIKQPRFASYVTEARLLAFGEEAETAECTFSSIWKDYDWDGNFFVNKTSSILDKESVARVAGIENSENDSSFDSEWFEAEVDNGWRDIANETFRMALPEYGMFKLAIVGTGLDISGNWQKAMRRGSRDALLSLLLTLIPNIRSLTMEIPFAHPHLQRLVAAVAHGKRYCKCVNTLQQLEHLSISPVTKFEKYSTMQTEAPFPCLPSLKTLSMHAIVPYWSGPDTALSNVEELVISGVSRMALMQGHDGPLRMTNTFTRLRKLTWTHFLLDEKFLGILYNLLWKHKGTLKEVHLLPPPLWHSPFEFRSHLNIPNLIGSFFPFAHLTHFSINSVHLLASFIHLQKKPAHAFLPKSLKYLHLNASACPVETEQYLKILQWIRREGKHLTNLEKIRVDMAVPNGWFGKFGERFDVGNDGRVRNGREDSSLVFEGWEDLGVDVELWVQPKGMRGVTL
ncbi:hypothetical protein EJ08DRAFT_683596 [Tothia fuscella]|uniref:F-box domain-containing protein n=1 Tax=Tothia fuscella TaxID=1048955 RepID=A0A9P4TT69_9PEZI|nr:hypothetical protein EJ08DRAFT_683596 [Tothia fuscella]